MRCPEIQKNLSAYADGDLLPAEREKVALHVRSCTHCAAELDNLRRLAQLEA